MILQAGVTGGAMAGTTLADGGHRWRPDTPVDGGGDDGVGDDGGGGSGGGDGGGGWGPTFWFFKSLDNNMVYTLGIYVYI